MLHEAYLRERWAYLNGKMLRYDVGSHAAKDHIKKKKNEANDLLRRNVFKS